MRDRVFVSNPVKELQRIDQCPACKARLYATPHPIDQYVQLAMFIPIFIFIAGIYSDSFSLKVASYLAFATIGLAVVVINNLPSYKKWRYFQLME